jgi:serine/threonine-protein kinase
MASVYEVRHEKTDHVAALKVPQVGLEQALVDRFLAEATVHFQLVQRPHIVAPLSFGTLPDSRPYLVMQFVEGQTLEEWLRARGAKEGDARLELAEALRFGIQLAEGLSQAHGLNPPIIHRDLKPANVFVEARMVTVAKGQAPNLLIGDFGLAWRRGGEALHSGTPEYISPEQALNLEPTVQSDLYTLGVILYELLEGCLPIRGADVLELMDAHRRAPPRPLEGDYPEGVAELVMELLEKHPENRPSSARQVVNRLTSVLDRIEGRRDPTQVSFDLNAYQAARPTEQLPPLRERAAAAKRDEARDQETLARQESLVRGQRRNLVVGLVLLAAIVAFFVARAVPSPTAEPAEVARVEAPVVAPAVVPLADSLDAGSPTSSADAGSLEAVPVPTAAPDELAPVATVRPKPQVPKPAACEPTADWKRLMRGNLEVLETNGRGLPALEMEEEAEKVGRAIAQASTPAECAKANSMFEALKKRALK